MPAKLGSPIPKLKRFNGKTSHDLQKYILSLNASQINLIDMLASDDDFVYCPSYDISEVHRARLKMLHGHCGSSVQLAKFVRTSGLAKSISQALNAVSSARSKWMLANVADSIQIKDARQPTPEPSVQEQSEDQKQEAPPSLSEASLSSDDDHWGLGSYVL